MKSKTTQVRRIAVAAGAIALSIGIATGAVAQPPLRSGWNLAERVATMQAYAEGLTIPGHFYVEVNDFVKDSKLYVNYQNGYAVYAGSTIESGVEKLVGGKNFSQALDAETFRKTDDTFDAACDYSNRIDASGWTLHLGVASEFTEVGQTKDGMIAAFKAGYNALTGYDAGSNSFPDGEKYNPGIWIDRAIEFFPGTDTAWIPLFGGEGTGVSSWFGGKTGVNYLSYNREDQKVYLIANEFVSPWQPQWGDPIGNAGAKTFKIDGVETTYSNAQMFANGYAVSESGTVVYTAKPYDYENNNYGVMPGTVTPPEGYAPPDVGHNFFGPVSAPTAYKTVYKVGNLYYVNYPYGYVTCTETAPFTYAYYYGRNVSEEGVASTVSDHDAVTNRQRNDVDGALGSLVADTESAQAKFKAAYKTALAAGKYLGYSASGIYVHQDVTVLQRFWHGDGMNSGNQEAYLAYNKGLDDAYAVTKFSAYWLERHGEFGAPRGLEGAQTFKVNGVEATYPDAQMFDKGFIYRDDDGIKHMALAYDAENNNYGTMPEIPEEVTLPEGYTVEWHNYGGTQGTIYKTGNVYYVNYQFGYVKCTDNAGVLSYHYRYGRNANASGAETLVEFEGLFAKQKNATEAGNNIAALVVDEATVPAKFKAGYKEAYDANQIPGYSYAGFEAFDGFVIQGFWRGDGNRIEDGSPELNRAYLVYNKAQDAAHAVTAFSEEWMSRHTDLGAPVVVYGAQSFKVKGVETNYSEAQLFTGGYIYRSGNEVKIEIAAYDAEHNNYGEMPTTINPPDAWPGYYGAQNPDYIKDGKVTYINYANGYVKCTETASKMVFDYFYGRNIDAALKVTFTDAARAADTMNFTIQNGVNLTGSVVDVGTVAAKFRAGWIASFNAGQIPGVTPGQIYIFNGTVIQNYWHGMGNANAMKEGYLTYHKATDATYYVGRYASTWLSLANNFKSARTAMGEQTFKVNGKDVTYKECQLFEGGYIYTDGTQFKTVLAFYDSLNGTYIEAKVPANFGAMVGNPILNGDETYYNFEHGAVKALKSADGNIYTNHPARNFDAAGTMTMQSIDYYLGMLDAVNIVGNFSDAEKTKILELLKTAYTEQFNAGFFPGFPDADVQMWDGIFGLQCFIGDSTGNPFSSYDARSNVLTFSINVKEEKVIILKNEMLVLWSKLRIAPAFAVQLGAPTGDMKTDGDNVYQQFGDRTLICVKGNIETWVVTSKTYEEWKAAQAGNGEDDRDGSGNGHIGDKVAAGCGSVVAGGSAVAGLGGLIAAALMIFKKKRGGKDA